MTETKQVTWRHLKVGDKIEGWSVGATHMLTSGEIVAVNASYVDVLVFKTELRQLNSEETMFDVELTEAELHTKYEKTASEIVKNIQNRLNEDEIGYHEMWNSWLVFDPYEVAAYCEKEKFKIIGHAILSRPKIALFSGEWLDVGVCCEYENGERFWCHTQMAYVERFKKRYPELH